jgi:hypothetical protein
MFYKKINTVKNADIAINIAEWCDIKYGYFSKSNSSLVDKANQVQSLTDELDRLPNGFVFNCNINKILNNWIDDEHSRPPKIVDIIREIKKENNTRINKIKKLPEINNIFGKNALRWNGLTDFNDKVKFIKLQIDSRCKYLTQATCFVMRSWMKHTGKFSDEQIKKVKRC